MQIFHTDDTMSALWSFLQPLAAEIPIYKQTMDEADENVPESYLLIRTDITDMGAVYGDGRVMIRRNTADLLLVSKCTGALSDDIHNVNRRKVKAIGAYVSWGFTGTDFKYGQDNVSINGAYQLVTDDASLMPPYVSCNIWRKVA